MKCLRVVPQIKNSGYHGSVTGRSSTQFQLSIITVSHNASATSMAMRMQQLVERLQQEIVSALEAADGKARFQRDYWERDEGGGGLTMVIEDGAVFEKGGVNTSAVHGMLPDTTARLLGIEAAPFFATGVSLVIHPRSPYVPTVHANFRYFGIGADLDNPDDEWFGGGADLTPYFPYLEDARHFHQVWKDVCSRHPIISYDALKHRCDEYFFLPHRGEARGVGGIFYDYLRGDVEAAFAFTRDAGERFIEAYVPIVDRRREVPYGEREVDFQKLRRGRYVEFNLLFDRGTRFGVETGGRTESILMSLPPEVSWRYDMQFEEGSTEGLASRYFAGHDWLSPQSDGLKMPYEGIRD